jgi:hypothetical protein
MRFHIAVTPDEDEETRQTSQNVADGVAWLRQREADGVFEAVEEWEQPSGLITGGYVIGTYPDRAALDADWATYPLRDTVTLDVHMLAPRNVGFDGLADRVAASERTRANA